jgi:exonuclease III
MILKIISFNVRGLNDTASIPTLRNYVESIPSLDVLCLHETKLLGQTAASLGQRLWQSAQCWSIEASAGYAKAIDGTGVGKGGIAMLLAPK